MSTYAGAEARGGKQGPGPPLQYILIFKWRKSYICYFKEGGCDYTFDFL